MTYLPELPHSNFETDSLQQTAQVQADESNVSRFSKIKYAVESAVVAAEVLPVNEALRFGAFGAFTAYNSNPVLGGLVLGAATFAIEGSAAIAAADLLHTERGSKVMKWSNDKLHKLMPRKSELSKTAEAGIAYLGGTAVVLMAKNTEDPTRTVEQDRKHGIFTAAWLSGVLAVQGTLAANGIHNPEPETIGAGLLGLAVIPVMANWAKKKIKVRKNDH